MTWVDVTAGTFVTRPGGSGRVSVSASGNRVAVSDVPEIEAGHRDALVVTVIDRSGGRWQLAQPTKTVVGEQRAELSPCGRTMFLAHEKPGEGENAEPIPVVQFWEVLSGERRAEYVTPFVAGGLGVSPCGRRIATTHRDAPVYLWDVFGEMTDPQPKPDGRAVWGTHWRRRGQGVLRPPPAGAAPGRRGGVAGREVDRPPSKRRSRSG